MYGRSILPLLTAKARRHWDLVFTSRHCGSGEGPPRYAPSHITATGSRWSLVVGREPFEAELFDRRTDAEQLRNVIHKHPQIAKRMHAGLGEFMREGGAGEEYIHTYARI